MTSEVKQDGVTIHHGESSTHLLHDYKDRKVTLQVSTSIKELGVSWKRLLDTTEHILLVINSVWIACRTSVKIYCAHCLFLKDSDPDFEVDPDWFHPVYDSPNNKDRVVSSAKDFAGVQPVTCGRHAAISKSFKPTVPKPLKFPCE